jgi:hypothetical protein
VEGGGERGKEKEVFSKGSDKHHGDRKTTLIKDANDPTTYVPYNRLTRSSSCQKLSCG